MSDKKMIRVRDVMHSAHLEVDGLTTVADALKLMRQESAHALIIKKRDDNDEYGLVLVSDIAKKVLAVNKAPERVNVYEIMSKPVLSVRPDMQVRYCARMFNQFGLTLAPVIDSAGEILGLVNYDDLVLRGLALE
ncbi:CBS domain-containing protein [Marinospirillum alkaliphilum]|uniref:CBS domain-containing protein n=1 Tax=Marinospirillum alkaliphilum DSM 21637 TaxID=1122209 RepID=A0A1K1UZ83_9GAMM|nr:CBS domain-containing protein [Marinospirillum alkaliphilum]SFX18112.1 CBS domain-containing protein [Marinospirillum alkaliphilum DSM 21637]